MPSVVSLYPNTVELLRRLDFMLQREMEGLMVKDIDITPEGFRCGRVSFTIHRYSNNAWRDPAPGRGRRRGQYEWQEMQGGGDVLKIKILGPISRERRIARDERGMLCFV